MTGAAGRGEQKLSVPDERPVIEVRDLDHWFVSHSGGRFMVLRAINLVVTRGELVALVGPSGCGKTTLLNIIAGLEPVQAGLVSVIGGSPRSGKRGVAYMFARDALLPWRTAAGNVALSLELATTITHRKTRESVLVALEQVGLGEFMDAYPAQLSQGMRQRVALARTLVSSPELLLMDEPFGALDAQTKLVVQDGFMRLRDELRTTTVLVTHDLSEAIALADRVVLLSRRPGRLRAEFSIDLPRPRSVVSLQGEPRFHRLFETLWSELRSEVANSEL